MIIIYQIKNETECNDFKNISTTEMGQQIVLEQKCQYSGWDPRDFNFASSKLKWGETLVIDITLDVLELVKITLSILCGTPMNSLESIWEDIRQFFCILIRKL